jgi:hypothetical protein
MPAAEATEPAKAVASAKAAEAVASAKAAEAVASAKAAKRVERRPLRWGSNDLRELRDGR